MKSKSLIIILLAILSLNTYAQIALEHTYPNAGCFQISPNGQPLATYTYSFYLVHLEIDGDKYVALDRVNQQMDFYNLNHTFYKSIDYSNVYTGIWYTLYSDKINCSISYISQNLFDTDSLIELMYSNWSWNIGDSSFKAITQIVKEDGSILFTDTAAPFVRANPFNYQYYCIYNTTNGTKMILNNVDGAAEVFSLPGTLSTMIASNNNLDESTEMNLFPNPAINRNTLTINYQLPDKIKTAMLVISDQQGKQIKTYQIGRAMNNIILNISEFISGTYYYSILTTDGALIESKKSIVIQ